MNIENNPLIKRILIYLIHKNNGKVIFGSDLFDERAIGLIRQIKLENEMLMDYNEAEQLILCVKNTSKIEGDIAEIGAYKGGSAKLICEYKGDKNLYVFDTFEGLPEIDKSDNQDFYKTQFLSDFEFVKDYLKKYKNVFVYKGLFPDNSKPIDKKRFSFVNLDVDLYEGTKNCLEYFYDRMNSGGRILVHDYVSAKGVRKAVDEFLEDKKESVIIPQGSQCLIVKLGDGK